MRKTLKYLKPYWASVIAIVLLVFGQVQCELALPDYMSSIVTYGIQYNGIEETTPNALTSETISHIALFESDIYDIYTKIEKGDQTYIHKYPQVKNEDIYVLKDNAQMSEDEMKAFVAISLLKDDSVAQKMNFADSEALFAALQNPQVAEAMKTNIDKMLEKFSGNTDALARLETKQAYIDLGMNSEKLQSSYIMHNGGMMLLIALAGSLMAIASAYLASRVATSASRDLRRDVFEHVESFSSNEFSTFSTATLITRTTNDIQQVQTILTMLLRIVLLAPMMGMTSLFKVLRYPSMFSILVWVLIVIVLIMSVIFALGMPKFKIIQQLVDKLNLVMREQLEGILVIRAFNTQKKEEDRFDQANRDITKVNIFVNRLMAALMPIMTFIMSISSILIIWFGAKNVDLGNMQIGDMMAFLQYSMNVLISFMIIAGIGIMLPRSLVSAKRIFEVLETNNSIVDPINPKHLPKDNQVIRFDHVSFAYPGAQEEVLSDINFAAKPGETIAFIGSTGSGKSTLINLLPRFYDVTSGGIYFGDVNIKDVNQKELRDHIGYIPQKGILFSGTIQSNLTYANPNASKALIDTALQVSQAKEFVDELQDGIDSPISQGGTNVSGGQKQRLSIARALTKDNAQIYIFDDTFSALDYTTDAKLRKALTTLTKERQATVFIVAQRISTIRHADVIVVLDNGKMAGIGKHEELLKTCKVYQEIAGSQLSEKELAL